MFWIHRNANVDADQDPSWQRTPAACLAFRGTALTHSTRLLSSLATTLGLSLWWSMQRDALADW